MLKLYMFPFSSNRASYHNKHTLFSIYEQLYTMVFTTHEQALHIPVQRNL
jgi:hypothetical protein